MNNKRSLPVIGAGLIGLGLGLLLAIAGFLLYDRFATGLPTQPSDSVALVRPVPPALTPSPSPRAASAATRASTATGGPASTRSPALVQMQAAAPGTTATEIPVVAAAATATRQPLAPALLSIPKLKIERPIVTIGRVTRDGQTDWDTDSLYATKQRADLVGHLKGTGRLGQSGNVVLTGHNYNRGRINWLGVFYSLNRLKPGDMVYVDNEEGERLTYEVVKVEKIAWPPRTAADTEKHMTHLTATAEETLTLVTCSGANLAPFPARLYVTARPVREAVAAAPAATSAVTHTATTKPSAAAPATTQPRATATATLQPTAPAAAPQIGASASAACRTTITVRRGETLAMLARKHGVTMRSIIARNGIKNPDRIAAGARLCIP